MEDNQTIDAADTEVQVERASPERLSIRASLEQQLDEQTAETEVAEPVEESVEEVVTEPQVERPALLPPADMRKEEKEAFLNPTAANAHILQEYLNRRAYETRSDYSRKMAEVEELRKQTASVYDTIKQYENDYAKQGLSLADVTRRSIAWDQAMQANPKQAAKEWLDAYGLSPQDLMELQQEYQQQYPQAQQQNYLTREEAERIADERAQNILKSQEQKAVEYYNQRVVESFMNSKPIFKDPETASQIEADMAPVVQALSSTGRYGSPEQVLETAYNYVINGNPAYSSLVSKMTAKPVIQEQKAAVEKAKAASRSISGSAGSGTPKIEAKNLRDNLRRRLVGGD
jgi:hypothetical protein